MWTGSKVPPRTPIAAAARRSSQCAGGGLGRDGSLGEECVQPFDHEVIDADSEIVLDGNFKSAPSGPDRMTSTTGAGGER